MSAHIFHPASPAARYPAAFSPAFRPRFPAKVTYTKNNKKSTKSYICRVTIKTASITAPKEITAIVGEKTSAAATKIRPVSATPTVTYTSNDDSIATVDASGQVTGVKTGEATITATMKCGTVTKKATTKVSVRAYDIKSVTQTKATELKVEVLGDAKAISASDIKITNADNVSVLVKEYKDGVITTYQDMADGKEYTVTISGAEKKFTATDGKVVAVQMAEKTVVAGKAMKIHAQLLAADGIILKEVAYPGDNFADGTRVEIIQSGDINGWYMDGDSALYIEKVGTTAVFDIVWHSGKWSEAGVETTITAKAAVTGVEAPAVSDWAVKVGDEGKSFAGVKETKLAVNDGNKAAYLQWTDAAKTASTDISNYIIESSNPDMLVVSQDDSKNAGGEVKLTPNRVGTAYVVIKDKVSQKVVKTLPVTIVAQRKASSISLDRTSVSLVADISNGYSDKAAVAASVKDQYGETMGPELVELKTGTENVTKALIDANEKLVDASAVMNGISTIKVEDGVLGEGGKVPSITSATVNVSFSVETGTGTLTRKIPVNVKTAKSVSSSTNINYTVEASRDRADAIITGDAGANTTIIFDAFRTKGGVKESWITQGNSEVWIQEVSMTQGSKLLATTTGSSIQYHDHNLLTVSGGSIVFNVNDVQKGVRMPADTYTLTVKIGYKDKDGKDKSLERKRQVIVTDTQPKVTVNRIKTSGTDVKDCFEIYYDGKKQDSAEVIYCNAKGDPVVAESGKMVSISHANVTITLPGEKGNKVRQQVNINQTVRIE